MSRKKKRADVKSKPKLEMTPMIDVVFNLLIFFLCSPFKIAEGQLDAFLPKDQSIHPPNIEKEDKIVIFLRDSGRRIPNVFIGRFPLETSDSGKPRFDLLVERLRGLRNTAGDHPVEIQSDRKIEYAYVVRALNACAKAEIEDVRFSLPMGASKILEARGK